jgi:hypothetical protein
MSLKETKFVEWQGQFIGVMPNTSSTHFVFVVDKFGHSTRLKPIKTNDMPVELIKKIFAERPWAHDKIIASLQKLHAEDTLKQLGENDGKRE